MKTAKVGLIGFGTIGAGVAKALLSRSRLLNQKGGVDLKLARVCDKDLKSKRPVKVPKSLLTSSLGKVLYDPSIDIVVELIGGINPAKEVVTEALRQGKHVVTANKALISQHGPEIFALARKLGLSVGFEASVGGGIPIIRSLTDGFVTDRIERIYGIVNGTSNFILSKMSEEGAPFDEVLALAQKMGYAERNPALDVEGVDSAHKLSILALIGFGVHIKPKEIYTEGILGIDPVDIRYASDQGYTIKLLAIAKNRRGRIEMRVHPTLIPVSHQLSSIDGVYNGIFISGDLVGENLFYGRGAGAEPTSSAVVSDIVSIAQGCGASCRPSGGVAVSAGAGTLMDISDIRTRYYIRFAALDKPGVLARVGGIFGRHKISIATVIQKERVKSRFVPIVMMTHEAHEKNMVDALKEISKLGTIKGGVVRIRIED